MDQAQFDKLPKYAQNEIQRLRANLLHAQRKLDQVGVKRRPAKGDTFIADFCRSEQTILPKNTVIGFQVGSDSPDYVQVSYDVVRGMASLSDREQGEYCNIYCRTAAGALTVVPSARNTLHLVVR